MGKEVKKSSDKKNNAKKNETINKKTSSKNNKKTDNEVMVEELKNTANNVKKEFFKAKDILVKGIKENTSNLPNEMKNIKEKITKKAEETKNKVVKEMNKDSKEFTTSTSNKETIEKQTNIDVDKYKDKAKDIIQVIKNKTFNFIDYLKKMDRKKLIVIVLALILIIFVLPNIFRNDIKYNYDYEYVEKIVLKYKVKVKVDFEGNWLFSTYDVDLSSGGKTETLKHGKDKTVEFNLTEGEHTLTFTNSEDSSISKEIKINVSSNMEIGIKLSCYYDKISATKTYTDKDIELISNEIKMTSDKSIYVYKNYKDVIKDLEKLGFTNIEEKPMYDIELGWTDEGEVDNVKIDGKDNYKRGDVFKNDVKVVVSYHMNINDDPSKISPPDVLTGKYDKVVQAFKNAGFTNVSAVEGANYSGKTENNVSSISIGGTAIISGKKYKPDEKVVITYYGNSKDYDGKEEDELSLYYAKKAFEEYGKKKYPYGFKCHWIVNNIAQEQSENGKSWFFKVGVTIENAYGNKYDAIAEGTVSGNDYSQKVSGFYVN